MMNRSSLVFIITILTWNISAAQWKLGKDHIVTRWAQEVTPQNAWPEYPRPDLVRPDWKSLNGLWSYAIQPKEQGQPAQWQGEILVPFPVESALSGVQQQVGGAKKLWYQRTFDIPGAWKNKSILLHFEAVDWECELWVNGQPAGSHKGGYDPFEFNITPMLHAGQNELVLSVYDPTDEAWQPVGKQAHQPGGIFYTSVTGIWQSVWLEPVSKTYISNFQTLPDIDKRLVQVFPEVQEAGAKDQVEAQVFYKNEKIGTAIAKIGEKLLVNIPRVHLWEPGKPRLYDLKLRILRAGKPVDVVSGYFGMRKVSLGKDADGFTKILINNHFIFQNGPLDQGFWPDGIYTAPNESAMKYDLEMIQKMGFNMLRKHVKVEPRRFYYWCDKMGLLVWQDMPNGDRKIGPQDADIQRSTESGTQFLKELKQLIVQHFNHPSIVMWVAFNEGWGQSETPKVVDYIRRLDPSRLVDNASGWTDRGVGDVMDWHHYPNPDCPPAEANRAIVLGEFGGLGLKTRDHMWEQKSWGYSTYSNSNALLVDYEKYYETIWTDFKKRGLSASIYTQITDVETEANGLMTYDRAITKVSVSDLYQINTNHFVPGPRMHPYGGWMNVQDSITLVAAVGEEIRYTLDGSDPTLQSARYERPIHIKADFRLRARAFAKGKSSRIVSADFVLTSLSRPRYLLPYSDQYTGGGDFALIDGNVGTENHADGIWQGFSGGDLEAIIELPARKSIHTLSMHFLENTDVWIFPPTRITVFTSTDGVNFEKAGTTTLDQPTANRPFRIFKSDLFFEPRDAKFVKIHAENPGKCPDWHVGKGEASWIFADEVKVE